MFVYVIRRVLSSIVVTVGVFLTVFVLVRLTPLDPVRYLLQQSGRNAGFIDPVEYAALRHQLGLDQPVQVQFVSYVNGVLHGDFGMSIINPGRRVSDILARGIPVSLHLSLMGLGLQFILGNLFGIFAAAHRNSLFDRLGLSIAILAGAVPQLVWGAVLIIIFGVQLRWLPIRGWDTPQHWILPTLTLAVSGIADYARFGRAATLEQIRKNYVRTARAKGVHENRVLLHHVLRNSLIPIITFVGPSFAFVIAGNFVVETMFGVPGVAFYAITASIQGDYPVIQATVLLIAIMITTVNLFVDLTYGVIDPRIRIQ